MTPQQKLGILGAGASWGLPAKEGLTRLDMPFSPYSRWKAAFEKEGIEVLGDRSPYKGRTWNQMLAEEQAKILKIAELFPDWSPRQMSCDVSDNHGLTFSPSSVERIVKRSGLVKARVRTTFPAGHAYRVKTKGVNDLLVKNW